MSTDREERLQRATLLATANLALARSRLAQPSGPRVPGDLYTLPGDELVSLEWLIVRAHPDQPSLLLVVPTDDFPLKGSPDVALSGDASQRRLTARCAQGLWIQASLLRDGRRVGFLSEGELRPVRQMLANLARGRLAGDEEQRQVDADPEYEDWLALLGDCRERLRAEAELVAPPRPVPTHIHRPWGKVLIEAYRARETQLAMAAAPGTKEVSVAELKLAGETFPVEGDTETRVQLGFQSSATLEVWLARTAEATRHYTGVLLGLPDAEAPLRAAFRRTVATLSLPDDARDALRAGIVPRLALVDQAGLVHPVLDERSPV